MQSAGRRARQCDSLALRSEDARGRVELSFESWPVHRWLARPWLVRLNVVAIVVSPIVFLLTAAVIDIWLAMPTRWMTIPTLTPRSIRQAAPA
jgi:hypothetical protein